MHFYRSGLARLFRAPKHVNVSNLFDRVELALENRGLLFMMHCVYLFLITAMFAHWTGCIWFAIGDFSRLHFPLAEDGKPQCWFANIPEEDVKPEHWHRAWIWSGPNFCLTLSQHFLSKLLSQ